MGYSPWGRKESDRTDPVCVCVCVPARAHTHTVKVSLSPFLSLGSLLQGQLQF